MRDEASRTAIAAADPSPKTVAPTYAELLAAVVLVTRTAELPKGRARAGRLSIPGDTFRACSALVARVVTKEGEREDA